MAEKKKKSKFKKILKNLGKVAMLGAAGYGASKLFGGRKGPVTGVPLNPNLQRTLRNQRNKAIDAGVLANVHDSESAMAPEKKSWWSDTPWPRMAKGGRVTGIAKRGFGRALMKGKK